MMRVEQEEGKVETSQQKNSKFGGNARKGSSGAKSFATGLEEIGRRGQGGKKQPERCRLCKNDHNLDECGWFKMMSFVERMDFVKSNGLCIGLLKVRPYEERLPWKEDLRYMQLLSPKFFA